MTKTTDSQTPDATWSTLDDWTRRAPVAALEPHGRVKSHARVVPYAHLSSDLYRELCGYYKVDPAAW